MTRRRLASRARASLPAAESMSSARAGTEFQIVTPWRWTACGPAEGILVAADGRNDDGAAHSQDAKKVEDRQVEFERRYPQHAVGGGDGEALGEVGQGIAGGAVLDGDPFGNAGAARGVDHVGGIVGRGGAR